MPETLNLDYRVCFVILLSFAICLAMLLTKIITLTNAIKLEKIDKKSECETTEQKAVKLALQKSEDRFQRLAANIPGVIYQYVLHPDGSDEFIYVSPGCRDIYETEPEELMRDFSVVWAMIHPTDVEGVQMANNQSAQTLEPFDIEFRLIPPSGRLKWIQVKSYPQRQSNGDLVFDGLVMDISGRKEVESKLRRSEALLASAQRLAHVGSWEYDSISQNITWSEETFRIYGIDPKNGEPTLAECFQFIHPEDRAKVEESFSDIIINGASQEVEYRLLRSDGSVRYIEGRGEALFNHQNQVTKIFGSFVDMTERKESERERLRLLTILESSTDHIGMADTQGNVLWNNAQAKKIIGLPPDADVTHTKISQYHPQWALTLVQNQGLPTAAREGFWMGETALLCSDGNEIPVSQMIIAHKPPDGEVEYFSTIMRDISSQKSYSLQLQQAKEAAEASNRAKSEFIARMNHELRTPMCSILGFTQIMRQQMCNTSEHQTYLDIINKSGQHLLELINDVLSMSKIEAASLKLIENSFDLYSLLKSLEEPLRLKAAAKQILLTFDITQSLPQYITADESKLKQVLLSLIGNAIKFTKCGSVMLKAFVVDSEEKQSKIHNKIHFEIIDTGLGIDPLEMDNLFKPFEQTKTGRNSQEGTGLGLTISRKFVQLMGGDITAQSVVGRGSVFSFEIPIKLANAIHMGRKVTSKRVKSLAPNQAIYRILIVDDIWEHRQLIEKLLAPLGFEIRSAENEQQALEIGQNWHPHLIFMDIKMPVMNGYDAAQAIKAIKAIKSTEKAQATKIVAITANAFDEERTLILSSKLDGFISKPFRDSEIFDLLAKCLGVRYIYFETASVKQSSSDSFNFTESDLAVMSDEWVQKLRQAAYSCSDELIFRLLEEIPTESATLLSTLYELTYNYQFDKIIELTNMSQI
jgi:PAS domain S-box-containing protein